MIRNDADINTTDNLSNTPLHYVSSAAKQELVQLLIENGADINYQSQDGSIPLYLAAYSHH